MGHRWLGFTFASFVVGCGPTTDAEPGEEADTEASASDDAPPPEQDEEESGDPASDDDDDDDDDDDNDDDDDDDDDDDSTTGEDAGSSDGEPEDAGSSGGEEYVECEPLFPDCPDGYKCQPYLDPAGLCVPLADDPVPHHGECIQDSIDDCDAGSMCLPSGEGGAACLPLCSEADEVECEGVARCIGGPADLDVCVRGCDPLLQDCAGGYPCRPGGFGFFCYPPEPTPADLGEDCDGLGCQPGQICTSSNSVETCEAEFCCTPLCDVDSGEGCDGTPGPTSCDVSLPASPVDPWDGVGVCVS